MSSPQSDLGLSARSEVAVRGVALDLPDTFSGPTTTTDLGSTIPLRRPGGAGPSADGHVLVDGLKTTIPINPASPYRLRDGRLVRTGPDGGVTDLGVDVATIARPAFYDLTTADGVPY
jgi:hypothetical protein